jgi:limonene 1,2-monooxygenase
VADKWELLARVTGIGNAVGTSVIGTPDEMVKTIRALQEVTGGFGVVLGFAHDWANHEATLRSWDLFARYVIPEINGYTRNLKESAEYLAANKVELMAGLNAAVMAKVRGNKVAEAAMAVTRQRMAAQAQGSSWRPEPGAPATDADKGEK